jgi:hypothetical protein
MAQQTAVEWLIENIQKVHKMDWDLVYIQAKEMEKEQIINAFTEGSDFTYKKDSAELYYNETYSK